MVPPAESVPPDEAGQPVGDWLVATVGRGPAELIETGPARPVGAAPVGMQIGVVELHPPVGWDPPGLMPWKASNTY